MTGNSTKTKILNSLVQILETTPLEKVSVTDVARAAKVSRQTFYYHFPGLYEIFDWYIQKNIRYRDGVGSGINAPSPAVCVIDLCTVFEANRNLVMEFRRVFYEKFAMKVRCYILKAVHDNLVSIFPDHVDKEDLMVLVRFLGDGYVGVITRWFNADMKIDIREVFKGVFGALAIGVPADILGKAIANIDSESFSSHLS